MAPNDTEMRPLTEDEVEAVLQGSLQGTFHTPQMPASVVDSMSMTSYVSPNSQGFSNYTIGSPNLWAANNSPEASMFPYMIDQAGERFPLSQYTECKAGSGVDQINGFVIVCDTGAEDKLKSPQGRYYYKGCKKLGSGTQVNGIELVYHGGKDNIPAVPGIPGHWENMDMLNAEGKEMDEAPKNQINGGRARPRNGTEMGWTAGSAQ
ncbi:hypothetical protein V8C37DRAFT_265739 [Trichoderma ceciliae]